MSWVHRQLPEPAALHRAGKSVINIVPAESPDKGDARLALRRRENADTAIYVGDDVSDEAVFRIDQPGRLLSVRVGLARLGGRVFYSGPA